VLFHLLARSKRLRRRDVVGRRRMLHFGGLLLGGAALWPMQQAAEQIVHAPGDARRFTGSRESASYAGNAFPTSSWVADQPRPLDVLTWRLALSGAVQTPMRFTYDDLAEAGDELEATLDCTGGFYSTQRWRGARVGRLLDAAGLTEEARFVRFVSVTSYRWSLPVEEARQVLLATQVGDEALSHEHGFPVRLVAPGRRGMEWVKWVVAVEVLTGPDPGQLLSIFTSSFTPAGRGVSIVPSNI
jgi:DMSO/TMAO reductase YedYZ molybdopterin-dependent catalytic subunit